MDKVTPKYFILPRSITVIIGEKNYHISNDNLRYHEAIAAIESDKLDDLAMIVDPTLRLGDENFQVKDGLVQYKEEILPAVLGDQFLKYKVETVSFLSLVNFWMNLKFRVDFDKAKEKVVAMLNMNAYPLTKDGFVIIYRGEDTNWFTNPVNGDVEIPFYSYASCSPSIRVQLEKRVTFENLCMEEIGFHSKKLNKLALDKSLDKAGFKFRDNVFIYGAVFKGILSSENFVTFLEKEIFYDRLSSMGYNSAIALNALLSGFTEKKITNFLTKFKNEEEKAQVHTILPQAGEAFLRLKQNNINIDMHRFQSFMELFAYMQEELYKLQFPLFSLNLEEHFPELKGLDLKINDDLAIVIPQTSRDLHQWSNEMKNCIGGYSNSVSVGQTLVLGVFSAKENKIIYNIEILNFKIRQFVRKNNLHTTQEEQKPVVNYFLKNGLLKEKEK